MSVQTYLSEFYRSVINVIYPPLCLICGLDLGEKILICGQCEDEIERARGPVCDRCGAPLRHSGESCICRNLPDGLTSMRSSVLYDGVAKDLIHLFKFRGYWSLASHCVDKMIEDGRSLAGSNGNPVVVGVPLHRVRLRERGYDQAGMLARLLSGRLGLDYADGALVREKNSRPQSQLSLAERTENMSGAFCIQNPSIVENKTVLLVDDVATTGITLSSCTDALTRGGAREVLALTFARRMLC